MSEFVYKDVQIIGDILNEKQYFTYDFGRIVTGLFSLELNVIEDAEVYLSWSEKPLYMLVFGRLLRAALSDRNVIKAASIILNF